MPTVNGWIVVVYRLWVVRLYRAGLDGDHYFVQGWLEVWLVQEAVMPGVSELDSDIQLIDKARSVVRACCEGRKVGLDSADHAF